MRKCLPITAAFVAVLAVSAVSGAGTVLAAPAASAAADPTVTNYTDPSIAGPIGITSGPDGALWFANSDSTIGRISTGGVVTNYTGTGISVPRGITSGPDGALWFTNSGNNSIGRISTGGTVTNYTGTGSLPWGITNGPDGAVWFTNASGNSIGRISTGGVVTNYTGTGISVPYGITSGPDGALWFTNSGNNSIGRISTGGVVTNYTGTGISGPEGITSGPDGALWFANSGNNSIGRITTGGTVTNYTGTGISGPYGITSGPDGALWFTNMGGNSIGRITTGGVVTNYTGTGVTGPWGITSGPDGALWFANYGNSTIGRITTPPPATTATAVTTSLSGDGQSGTSITVPAGTAVTDTAILSGTNASTATGTVTYNMYSDSACTVAVPAGAGKAQAITTPGTLPASNPVPLSTPGTYYWQASYSGDANNGPSTSTCGTAGEVETVAPPGCGSAAVGYQATPTATSLGNWAGYDAESSTACTFTSVTGQWIQPALACPTHDEGTLTAEFWVGLDGAGSATVEQTGIEAQCVWGPSRYHTEYQAWYQMYPDPAVDFANPDLEAGSLVKATVTYLKNGKYSLNLTVTTKGRTLPPLSTEQLCTHVCENMSAEWVVEKVQGLGLADFRIWHLTDGEATTAANPGDQTVASFKPVRDIINDNPYLRAGPAGLDGSSFFVLTIKR